MPQRTQKENPNDLKGKQKFRDTYRKLRPPEDNSPALKTKITFLTSEQLGDLIARYSAWREFCEDQHLTAIAEYMEAKEKYDYARDKEMIMANADTVTTQKAIAKQSMSVKPLATILLDKEIYMKMIAGKLESYSNTLTMLSRELTRKGYINL